MLLTHSKGVPEGAYYERIFHLFPFLRQCHLRFRQWIDGILDRQIVLPLDQAFMPIERRLSNLQPIVPAFLKHLLEHHPQVRKLDFRPTLPWLPDGHSLINSHSK